MSVVVIYTEFLTRPYYPLPKYPHPIVLITALATLKTPFLREEALGILSILHQTMKAVALMTKYDMMVK